MSDHQYPKRIPLANGCYWQRYQDEFDGIPTTNGDIHDTKGDVLTTEGADQETAVNLARCLVKPSLVRICSLEAALRVARGYVLGNRQSPEQAQRDLATIDAALTRDTPQIRGRDA